MRKLVPLFALLLCLPAFAGEEEFARHKQRMTEELDSQISALQSAKGCVANAQKDEELKGCRKEIQEARQAQRERRKEHRREMLDKRIERLQKQKAEMDSEKK
ncbi:MAG: hypothetical protein NDJ89_12915 [Oligoflexia bacterium]|nr:hypothetical protein [Oligoflexia bacterium]